MAVSAQAAEYKPGTIGYLLEDCRAALEQAQSVSDLHQSMCGAFAEGYLTGWTPANWIVLGEPDPQDPCHEEQKKNYERINARICPYLPKIDVNKQTAENALIAATTVISRWAEFRKKKGKGNPLNLPMNEINSMIAPGAFCDDLAKSYPVNNLFSARPFAAPYLKIRLKDAAEFKEEISTRAKLRQCADDLKASENKREKFITTRCGAEISGYIAGIHSTQHLQKNRPQSSKQCKKQIDRLYKSLNIPEAMCVNADSDPVKIAALFTEKFSDSKANTLKANMKGGPGYWIIGGGQVCAHQREKKNPG